MSFGAYQLSTPPEIDARFGERERRGWERYRSMGADTIERMEEHGIRSLAQFYTSKIKYDPDRFAVDSTALHALLRARGFLG